MVVEGAVVMVENIVRNLSHRKPNDGRTPMESIRQSAHEVQRPVFYAIGIIITAYIPIFTLQRVEGRLFKPMAWTVEFRTARRADFRHDDCSGTVQFYVRARR